MTASQEQDGDQEADTCTKNEQQTTLDIKTSSIEADSYEKFLRSEQIFSSEITPCLYYPAKQEIADVYDHVEVKPELSSLNEDFCNEIKTELIEDHFKSEMKHEAHVIENCIVPELKYEPEYAEERSLGKSMQWASDTHDDALGASHSSATFSKKQMEGLSTSKPFKCLKCSYATNRSFDLKRHKLTHSAGKQKKRCSGSANTFIEQTSLLTVLQLRRSSGKEFVFPECPISFSRRSDLKRHQRTHSSKKSIKVKHAKLLKCSICSYTTARRWNLTIHERIHSGVKPFKCPDCDYAAIHQSILTKHQRKHSGEKPHVCPECSFASSSKAHIRRHMLTHSGEKPFTCSQCDYAASRKDLLVKHQQAHSTLLRLRCSQCPYATNKEATLKVHLQIHQQKHSGQTPFICSDCFYTTFRKESMKRHMKTHSEVKEFKCSECSFAAHRKDVLKAHLEREHSK